MQHKLSRDNIADLAHQAMTGLRRLMTSSHDSLTAQQQNLVTTSRQVEDRWQRKRQYVDDATAEQLCNDLADELAFQLHPDATTATDGRKPLSESSMLLSIEAARLLSWSSGEVAAAPFTSAKLPTLLTQYFVSVPLCKKLREACAATLVEILSGRPEYLASCLEVAAAFFQSDRLAEPEEEEKETDSVHVSPLRVYLATLFVTAIHRSEATAADAARSLSVSADFKREEFVTAVLRAAYRVATAPIVTGNGSAGETTPPSPSTDSAEGYRGTVCIVFLALISGLLRGHTANKRVVLDGYGEEFAAVWTLAVSSLWKMETTLNLPTTTPKGVAVSLDPYPVWQSELLEVLIELITDGSFTRQRLVLRHDWESPSSVGHSTSAENSLSAPRSPGFASPTSASSPGGSGGGGFGYGHRRYDPIPPHWDTLLTGGSALVWHLAASLSSCVILPGAADLLETCLLGMDTSSAPAESVYRGTIATLMLLCASTPQNAEVLAESAIFETLIAIVTHEQTSVFPAAVELRISGGGTSVQEPRLVVPESQLNTNTTQLTVAFLSSLASTYFPPRIVRVLMDGVERMREQPSCQSDADIVESLLNVMSSSYLPPTVLFFPGNGSVVCKVDRFAGRWFGYTFSAWVNPVCVWEEGSHLFSFTEQGGNSVAILVVANGRSCCLALRTQTSKDYTISTIADSSLPPETWSHIVFTHSLVGLTVFVNGRKLDCTINVTFPKEPSKRHRLDLALGGEPGKPSFFGYVACIELFEGAVSDKDVGRLFTSGPRPSDGDLHSLLSISAAKPSPGDAAAAAAAVPLLPICVSGSLFGKNEGISVQRVIHFSAPCAQAAFEQFNVMQWALQTMHASHDSPAFHVIAKLCSLFVSTGMRMTTSDAELSNVLKDNYMERLKAEVLTWDDTFMDFPAIALSSVTARGSSRLLNPTHPSTQAVISTLLARLEEVGVVRHAPNVLCNPSTVTTILRELSDCLLVPENVALFQMQPNRFEKVLSLSLHLPQECVESVVVLIEKLCKGQTELEHTLLFLVQPQQSDAAEMAKAEILRMLFDVARANTSMCDVIGSCFKGCGTSFLIMLVNGMNHSSESIRVFALRLLSLMLHVNRKFRESFVKSRGFEVLSKAITDPRANVPIRLPTLDCLFQVAFDSYRPAEKLDEAMVSRLSGSMSKSRGRRASSKHHDPSISGSGTVGSRIALQGHLPGLISRRLKVTRREYSFDVTRDYAKADDRLQFDEAYRSKGVQRNLHVPAAMETALCVLGCLINALGGYTGSRGGVNEGGGEPSAASAAVEEAGNEGVPKALTSPGEAGTAGGGGGGGSTSSLASPLPEEDPPEQVVLRVLSYLEKVADVPQNGEALLPYPWLDWLWTAVSPVMASRHGSNLTASPLTNPSANRYPKKFSSAVIASTRSTIRKLTVLDMCRNSKATTVRRIKGIAQPPYLVRIVLEEVARHFSKGNQSELSDPDDANNVIKNLGALFYNIEDALDPFPPALGVEIVTSISALAVRNNSWVRMRMKNSTDLFDTRDRLAFFLLTTTRKLSKVEPKLLLQLLAANSYELSTVVVLLRRLTDAITARDVDEVEMLLLLLLQLASTDEDQRREMYRILGDVGAPLAELLSTAREGGTSPSVSQLTDSSPRDLHSTEREGGVMRTSSSGPPLSDDLPHGGSGGGGGGPERAMMNSLPTSQVVEWCRTNEVAWAVIVQSVLKASRSVEAQVRNQKERSEKEKAAVLKASRTVQERHEQVEAKVWQEFKRIRGEVEAEVGRKTTS